MILDKEALKSQRDQLVEQFSVLEAKHAKLGELETQLEQTEQEKMAHRQEATQLHGELAELKVKWAQPKDVVNSVVERESDSMESISNLEANLHSKTEEATTTKEKREKWRKGSERSWNKTVNMLR